jgi:hypothetical protein
MKLKKKTTDEKGRTVLVCDDRVLFLKRERRFVAQSEIVSGYWRWLELPNKSMVPDTLSFQLDTWNRE